MLLQPGSGGVPLAVPSTHAIDGALFAGVDGAIVRPMRDVEEVVRGERRPVWRRTSVAGSVSVLEASPAYAMDRTLVVGTSAGVYLSRDAGTTLKTPNGGPGDNPIVAAAFSPAYAKDRLIYVVELGGRIWRLRDMRGSGVG